ncbi:MAG: MFS transporter [Planctomycetes bacterium]|nr:MFS transporter [Planctomycetota bacterium]
MPCEPEPDASTDPVVAARAARDSWLGLGAFYAASFCVLGVYMQFLPSWLHEVRGFGKGDIAVILSAQTISRTIAGPLFAQWVDRSGDARRVLSWLSTGALGAFALFAWAPSLLLAWSVAFVFGCLYPPMHPIVDATAVRAAARHGYSFARLRVVGSVTFLVAILAVGHYLERAGTEQVFSILVVALLSTAIAARFVPRAAPLATAQPPVREPWWRLLRSGPFVGVLVSAALIQGSHATYYQLSTVHWDANGIGKSTAAWLWAEGVLAEIVLLLFARQTLERLRPTTLMLIGGAGAAVRWAIVGSTTSVPLLLASNWLHALSFAATYLGAIGAVERRVPAGQRATAQGMLGAATAGGGMVFCGLCGGFAFEAFGGRAFYLMSAFAAIGAGLAVLLRRRD